MRKPLYIIHGWAYSIEPWTSTVSVLRSKGYEVVQLKVPGLTEPSDKQWDIDGYVDWLSSELEGVDKPIVLGHSNGGRIALNFLKKYPDRFEKLILLSSAGVNVSNQKISLKRRVFKLLVKTFGFLKHIPLVRKVVYRILRSDYEAAPRNMKQTLHNMLESDKSLDISGINVPTSLLWGKADDVTPLAMGQKIASQLDNSHLRQFDGWGHAPYRTHPYQLAVAIIEELER